MEQVDLVDVSHDQRTFNHLEDAVIDLRFDVPVVRLGDGIDLGFDAAPDLAHLQLDETVIDLRHDGAPVVHLGSGDPLRMFGEPEPEAPRPEPTRPEAAPIDLTMPTNKNMWARPDTCLAVLVNRARFRQGGVAAVSKERTDLTELAVLSSRGGAVDARRLARLARGCR